MSSCLGRGVSRTMAKTNAIWEFSVYLSVGSYSNETW